MHFHETYSTKVLAKDTYIYGMDIDSKENIFGIADDKLFIINKKDNKYPSFFYITNTYNLRNLYIDLYDNIYLEYLSIQKNKEDSLEFKLDIEKFKYDGFQMTHQNHYLRYIKKQDSYKHGYIDENMKIIIRPYKLLQVNITEQGKISTLTNKIPYYRNQDIKTSIHKNSGTVYYCDQELSINSFDPLTKTSTYFFQLKKFVTSKLIWISIDDSQEYLYMIFYILEEHYYNSFKVNLITRELMQINLPFMKKRDFDIRHIIPTSNKGFILYGGKSLYYCKKVENKELSLFFKEISNFKLNNVEIFIRETRFNVSSVLLLARLKYLNFFK